MPSLDSRLPPTALAPANTCERHMVLSVVRGRTAHRFRLRAEWLRGVAKVGYFGAVDGVEADLQGLFRLLSLHLSSGQRQRYVRLVPYLLRRFVVKEKALTLDFRGRCVRKQSKGMSETHGQRGIGVYPSLPMLSLPSAELSTFLLPVVLVSRPHQARLKRLCKGERQSLIHRPPSSPLATAARKQQKKQDALR